MHKELFDQLVQVVATLRGENGCPWDKAQTHETLKAELIEETYEVIEAIDAKSSDKLQEELGDLLLQVVLNAQIAKDQGDFSINEVVRSITDKLIRRHPHVFGDVDAKDTETVLQNWEAIKRSEVGYEDRKSVLDGVPESLPSLLRAQKIQNRAARVGFDWDTVADVLPKTRGRNRGGQSECEKGGYRGDRDGDWRSSVLSGEPMPFFGGAGRGSVTPSGPQVYRPLPKNGGDT